MEEAAKLAAGRPDVEARLDHIKQYLAVRPPAVADRPGRRQGEEEGIDAGGADACVPHAAQLHEPLGGDPPELDCGGRQGVRRAGLGVQRPRLRTSRGRWTGRTPARRPRPRSARGSPISSPDPVDEKTFSADLVPVEFAARRRRRRAPSSTSTPRGTPSTARTGEPLAVERRHRDDRLVPGPGPGPVGGDRRRRQAGRGRPAPAGRQAPFARGEGARAGPLRLRVRRLRGRLADQGPGRPAGGGGARAGPVLPPRGVDAADVLLRAEGDEGAAVLLGRRPAPGPRAGRGDNPGGEDERGVQCASRSRTRPTGGRGTSPTSPRGTCGSSTPRTTWPASPAALLVPKELVERDGLRPAARPR